MTYTLSPTPKGYIITVIEKRKKYKYFLWDEQHTKEKYIEYVIRHNEYRLGQPFGNDIYPIYFNYKAIKQVDEDSKPINQLSKHIKMTAIWKYYRSFITEDTSPKLIKQYANEFKSNLSLLGLDGLYEFVQAQA